MLGAVVGKPGKLPPMMQEVRLKMELFDYVVGLEGAEVKVTPLKEGEPLIVNVNASVSVGNVKSAGDKVTITLKKPICADKRDRFVISRRVDGKWRLIGYGIL
jgi:translation initiation factor 2 subunit 3